MLSFNTGFNGVAPIQYVANRAQLNAGIESLYAGGGTNIYVGLNAAYAALKDAGRSENSGRAQRRPDSSGRLPGEGTALIRISATRHMGKAGDGFFRGRRASYKLFSVIK